MGKETWNVFDLRAHLGIVTNDMLAMCTRWDYPGHEIITSGFFSSIGIWPNHVVTTEMLAQTEAVIKLLEIDHLKDRQINQMSSGESRRFTFVPRATTLRNISRSSWQPLMSSELVGSSSTIDRG